MHRRSFKSPKEKVMRNMRSILTSLLCLLFIAAGMAQDVTNVRVSTTDEEVLVTYDLIGDNGTAYDVQVDFKMNNGQSLNAKTLKGDIGEVLPGKDKVVIWKVYDDINGLQGGLEPVFSVTPMKAPVADADTPSGPTPTPPNNNDDEKIIDVLEDAINGGGKNYRVGLKVGLGNSRALVNRGAGEFSQEFSWEGGVYYRYNLNRKLYLQPEVIYHSQRYTRSTAVASERFTHNQVRGQLIGGVKPIGLGLYFNAGLYYAYQFNGKSQLNENGNTIEESFSDFPSQNGEAEPFNNTDFGYILGGTLSFNRGGFALSLLVSRSFDSVLNDTYHIGDAAFEGLNLRHRSFHFVIHKKF